MTRPIALLVVLPLALLGAPLGCAHPPEPLSVATAASNAAADALTEAVQLQEAAFRVDAAARLAACPAQDAPCRSAAVAAALAAQAGLAAELERLGRLQRAIAGALEVARACQGAGQADCAAVALAEAMQLLPDVRAGVAALAAKEGS